MTYDVTFLDSGCFPQCKPDPAFPDGKDVDISLGASLTCTRNIPYPAPRCGVYFVECHDCGLRVALTVAGRPDDPRTVKLPCKRDVPPASDERKHS